MTFPPIEPVHSPHARRALRVLALVAGLGTLPAVPMLGQTAAEVQVTPETMTLGVGQRQTIFATAYDRQGNLIPNARFSFYSSDTLIAKVTRDGTVLGVGPGLAKVEARVQRRRASMAVLITGTGPASDTTARVAAPAGTVLTIDPPSLALLPGESVTLTPHAQREDATPTDPGRVSWKSLRPEVASVDASGLVIGVAPGRSIVQATTASGLMATTPVEVSTAEIALSTSRLVLGPDETDTLAVAVPSQANRLVRGGIQWQSRDTSIAVVGPTGIVTGRAPGQTDLVANGFGQERQATVVVHRLPQSLVVTPPASAPIQLPVKGVRTLGVVAEAADKTPIPEARVAWAAGDTTLVAFDPAKGTLTGKSRGRTTVTARIHGFEPVVWTVEVIPGVVGLDRGRLGLALGTRDTLRAALLDGSGRSIGPAPELQWSSERPDVVRVSAGGVVEALRTGRAAVTATAAWGKADTAEVLVTGDLLMASNRGGRFGIYQTRSSNPGALLPVLVENASAVQPALSPDRTRIAFSSERAGGGYDLFVMDADGRNPQRLTSGADTEGEPAWTPDGRRLIYTVTPREGPPQLFSMQADGGGGRQLTEGKGGSHSPAVSPDGRTVAFISSREGKPEVFVMPVDGGEARRLTRSGDRKSQPRFLPNGDLAYVVSHGRGARVMQVPLAGGEPAVMFQTDQPIASLAISRDGRRAAYVTGRLADLLKPKARFELFLQPLAPGSTPTAVPLRAGEQVLNPSF